MGKRRRTISDVTCFIESILSCRRIEEPDASFSLSRVSDGTNSGSSRSSSCSRSRSRSESMNGTSTNDRSAVSRVLTIPSGSMNPSDSQKSTGGAFTTEINFFCRAEEDLADMSLYLARVVSSARTPDAFVALVEHFSKYGAETVMLSLKRSGTQPKLLGHLCSVPDGGLTKGYQQ
ncbi:hypothetical protein TcCL_NonESM13168, partial [Trypanosoma cruzi]